MERTGYSKEDILHARNRHPYWKRKKMEGSAERTRQRLTAHDYSGGGSIDWTPERVTTFLELNGKDRAGRYEHRDWEIAEIFGSSIPSIQYMRRKYRRAVEMLGARASKTKLVEYLTLAESVLIRGPKAVENLKAERAKAARAQAPARSPSKTPAKKTAGKTPASRSAPRAGAATTKQAAGRKKPRR